MADLGFSSDQIESADRGLSFQLEGPLDTRLDPTRGFSALQFLQAIWKATPRTPSLNTVKIACRAALQRRLWPVVAMESYLRRRLSGGNLILISQRFACATSKLQQ